VLDLAALLSYDPTVDDFNDFITLVFRTSSSVQLNIDADGNNSGTDVIIELLQVTGVSLSDMINDGNIVLF